MLGSMGNFSAIPRVSAQAQINAGSGTDDARKNQQVNNAKQRKAGDARKALLAIGKARNQSAAKLDGLMVRKKKGA